MATGDPLGEERAVSGAASAAHPDADDETRQWLTDLAGGGRAQEEATSRLHELLLRVAYGELHRRRGRHPVTGPELDDLAHQAADDATAAVLAKLGQFRGESRFTTWAYKFAVLEGSAKLGRHFWQHPAAPMGEEDWGRIPDRFGIDPSDHAQGVEMADALRKAVDEVLTPHQRRVLVAVLIDEVPLDALVLALGSNRNAIYKTVFDARRKLRDTLAAKGYLSGLPTAVEPRNDQLEVWRP